MNSTDSTEAPTSASTATECRECGSRKRLTDGICLPCRVDSEASVQASTRQASTVTHFRIPTSIEQRLIKAGERFGLQKNPITRVALVLGLEALEAGRSMRGVA